jgi:hypothetical protein
MNSKEINERADKLAKLNGDLEKVIYEMRSADLAQERWAKATPKGFDIKATWWDEAGSGHVYNLGCYLGFETLRQEMMEAAAVEAQYLREKAAKIMDEIVKS